MTITVHVSIKEVEGEKAGKPRGGIPRYIRAQCITTTTYTIFPLLNIQTLESGPLVAIDGCSYSF